MDKNFRPRTIYEMGELCEDLIFMRTEKFSDEKESDSKKLALNRAGVQLLGNLGIIGRIFRRWYQTTWGWESPSQWFKGETPRMELSKYYPDLKEGNTYVSAQLLKDRFGEAKVIPALYEIKEIKKSGGIINMGCNFIPKSLGGREHFQHLPAPNFDPEFKEFISLVEQIEGDIRREKIEKLSNDLEERYWQIFWTDALMTIPLNCGLKLSHDKLMAISSMTGIIIRQAIKEQKKYTR